MPNMKYTLFRNRRGRRGISTVLGMLIFIGVLFTSVIPLFLYVNKVNSIYDQSVHEMSDLDLERTQEKCDVFVYPLSNNSRLFNVYIKNKCALDIKIERVWVNNICYNFSDAIVPAMGQLTIEKRISVAQLIVEGVATTVLTKVTSARGKSYSSLTNPLIWDGNRWRGGMAFYIQVVIIWTGPSESDRKYHINVTKVPELPGGFKEEADLVKIPHVNSVFVAVQVPYEGYYEITAMVSTGGGGTELNPTPKQIEIDFENNPEGWSYCIDSG